MEPMPDGLTRNQRAAWYRDPANADHARRGATGGPHPCPCCGCRTLDERGMYDICPVCFWEDSGQDDHNADQRGGPNGSLSLTEARENFRRIGACEEAMLPHVRPPAPAERPDRSGSDSFTVQLIRSVFSPWWHRSPDRCFCPHRSGDRCHHERTASTGPCIRGYAEGAGRGGIGAANGCVGPAAGGSL